jgi:hypothetical protein
MAFLNAFSAIGRFMVLAAGVAGGVGMATGGEARTALLIVALSIGIIGVVFTFVGSRLGRLAGFDKRLRSTGVAGTATVTSIRSLGVRVNGDPVLELGLDVDVISHAGFSTTIRQRVPLFWGHLTPGARVGVVVDPADRQRLAIDWDATVEGPPATTPMAVTVDAPLPDPSPFRDAEHLLRVGRSARAVIISMTDAGDMSELGLVEVGSERDDDRLFVVDMEVQQAGLDPYEVRVAHRVPEHLLGRVGPRTRVRVAVDRDDDHAVAIDWSSVGR